MATERYGSKSAGIFLSTFGFFWTAFYIFWVVGFIFQDHFNLRIAFWTTFFSLPFLAIGLLLTLAGTYQFVYREKIVISEDYVEVFERGFKKTNAWKELLSHYRGVRIQIHHSTDSDTGEIILMHPDQEKDITLVYSYDILGLTQKMEHFARVLRIPVLLQEGDIYIEIPPEDLEKTLSEKVKAGYFKEYVRFPTPQLSSRAKLEPIPDGVRIIHPHFWVFPRMIIVAAVCAWMGFIGRLVFPSINSLNSIAFPFNIVFWVIGFGVVCFWVFALFEFISAEELLVTSKNVRRRSRYPWGYGNEKKILAEDISDVIANDDNQGALVIMGTSYRRAAEGLHGKYKDTIPPVVDLFRLIRNEHLIRFGAYLSRQDKIAIKRYIISVTLQR